MTRSSRKAAGWALGGLILVAGVLLPISTPPVLPVTSRWVPLQPQRLELRTRLTGRIEPATLLTLVAPFDATVEDRPLQVGQQVARGQTLLVLDTSLLQIQLRDALAERLKANAAVETLRGWEAGQEMARARRAVSTSQNSLADTERKLKETRHLLERGIVARMELDLLEQQRLTQQLDHKAARAELGEVSRRGRGEHRQIADMQLANAVLRHQTLLALETQHRMLAPFAGLVVSLPGTGTNMSEKPIQRGTRISQGQPLFGIASLEQLNVVAMVHETDINPLREGMSVDVTGEGFEGVTLRGSISRLAARSVQQESHGNGATYEVTVVLPALIPDQREHIRLGMTAMLSVIVYHNPVAILIPHEALERQDGNHYVIHRASSQALARRTRVIPGRTTPQGIEVSGVEGGEVLASYSHGERKERALSGL